MEGLVGLSSNQCLGVEKVSSIASVGKTILSLVGISLARSLTEAAMALRAVSQVYS